MKDFHDLYLENRLKNWTAQKRPAEQVRESLLRIAAVTPQQSSVLDGWNGDYLQYQPLDWSGFFTSWMIIDAHHFGLTGSRLLA